MRQEWNHREKYKKNRNKIAREISKIKQEHIFLYILKTRNIISLNSSVLLITLVMDMVSLSNQNSTKRIRGKRRSINEKKNDGKRRHMWSTQCEQRNSRIYHCSLLLPNDAANSKNVLKNKIDPFQETKDNTNNTT